MVRLFFLCLLLFTLCVGCATGGKTTLLGMGVGFTSGITTAAISSRHYNSRSKERNMLIGTAVGSVIGAVAGYQSHKYLKKRKKKSFREGRKKNTSSTHSQIATGHSKLKPAKIRVRFVDDQVKGKTKIPAHFEYDIVEEAKWEQ